MSDYFSYEEKERVQDLEKAILQHERDLYERENHFNKEQIIAELKAEIDQLKQQLAEKDKEIEDCKRNELFEENMKILAVKNQTKLAIQELEKVKNFVNDLSGMVGHEWRVNRISILEQLDQQIKELKGE